VFHFSLIDIDSRPYYGTAAEAFDQNVVTTATEGSVSSDRDMTFYRLRPGDTLTVRLYTHRK